MNKRRRKKRKINIVKVLIALLILIVIITGIILLLSKESKSISKEDMYLSSSENIVKLFVKDEEGNLKEDKELARGTKISSYKDTITQNENNYTKIEYSA